MFSTVWLFCVTFVITTSRFNMTSQFERSVIRIILTVVAVITLLSTTGCASPRPVLYPNKYFNEVGATQAEKDIDDAINLAENRGLTTHTKDGENAARAGVDSGVGAGTAVAAGAASGGIGGGTAVSAGAAGVSGFTRWLFNSGQPEPVFRNFVETKLRAQGYQVMGWK